MMIKGFNGFKGLNGFNGLMGLVMVACVLAGCDRARSLSEIEEQERSGRLYRNAMDDYRAGRLDAAIKGFERVVLDEPKSYSAHFQLATLLHDVRKDYIGAIAHYRAYLALRPASDKATVAVDRVKLCETLLAAEIVKKAAVGPDTIKEENKRLTGERDALAQKVRKLEVSLAEANKTISGLKKDNESQHNIIAKLTADDIGAAPTSAKQALAELRAMEAEAARRGNRPTDAELLDDDDDSAGDRIRRSADIAKLRAEAEREDKADSDNRYAHSVVTNKSTSSIGGMFGGGGRKKKPSMPAHPETYTVQEGDTLYRISTRFYGNSAKWRAIRELNKATISTDGRLRVGQVIRLP